MIIGRNENISVEIIFKYNSVFFQSYISHEKEWKRTGYTNKTAETTFKPCKGTNYFKYFTSLMSRQQMSMICASLPCSTNSLIMVFFFLSLTSLRSPYKYYFPLASYVHVHFHALYTHLIDLPILWLLYSNGSFMTLGNLCYFHLNVFSAWQQCLAYTRHL